MSSLPAVPARNLSAKREGRLTEVARLLRQGRTEREIADELGVSNTQIHRDKEIIEARWQAAAREDTEAWKARMLARLDYVYGEAMAAWEKSKQKRTKTRVTSGKPAAGERLPSVVSTTVHSEEALPVPKFLEVAVSAVGHMAELLGLDNPQVQELVLQAYAAQAAKQLGMSTEDFMSELKREAAEAWETHGELIA